MDSDGDKVGDACDPCPLVTPADNDGDGAGDKKCGGTDCDDNNPNVYPGVAEVCQNALDDNCDGITDVSDPACQKSGPQTQPYSPPPTTQQPSTTPPTSNGDKLAEARKVLESMHGRVVIILSDVKAILRYDKDADPVELQRIIGDLEHLLKQISDAENNIDAGRYNTAADLAGRAQNIIDGIDQVQEDLRTHVLKNMLV